MGSTFQEWLALATSKPNEDRRAVVEDKPPQPENATDPSPAPTAVAPTPAQTEIGVSGTNNWQGRIHSEANVKLQWTRAYGTPGATAWGEWEQLHRTDHAVAVALGTLVAPLRDAELEVEPAPEADTEEAVGYGLAADPSAMDPGKPQDPPAPSGEEPGIPEFQAPEPKSQCELIADFVSDNFQKWLEPTWATLVEQIVTYGMGYGFSLHEIVWGTRPDKRVAGGTAFYIKKLGQRLPSSVKTDGWKERDGELVEVMQSGVRTLPDGQTRWDESIPLPADKILLCTWARSGNNYQGFSAFRAGWYMAKMRADLLRILAIGSQREACGVPVAEVDKDVVLTEPQRDELQRLLEDLVFHENAAIQLPPGVKMQWVFSQGANKGNVLDLWQALGTAIMELVQAQQTTLGNNDTGSRAVGAIHADAKEGFIKGVRAWLESCLNGVGEQLYTGLVKKLVDVNFGPQDEYPKLKLVLSKMVSATESLRQLQMMQAIETAKGAGLVALTEDDEVWARDLLGLPPMDPAKRQVVKDQEAAQKQAQADALAQSGGGAPPANGAPPFTKKGPSVKELQERIDAFLEGSRGGES